VGGLVLAGGEQGVLGLRDGLLEQGADLGGGVVAQREPARVVVGHRHPGRGQCPFQDRGTQFPGLYHRFLDVEDIPGQDPSQLG